MLTIEHDCFRLKHSYLSDATELERRRPQLPDYERAIRELTQTWLAATQKGDIQTVLGLMADDVVFMRGRLAIKCRIIRGDIDELSRAHCRHSFRHDP
jgi:hypothetical protein